MIAFEPLAKLSKDLAKSKMTVSEMRYAVDLYYQIQDFRKAAENQVRAEDEVDNPAGLLSWTAENMRLIENGIKKALSHAILDYPVTKWCLSVCGIGPVITAGLLAHIDFNKAPTPSHIWRFAGLDPTIKWEKGKPRPFNMKLKTLCAFKIGESFVKVQNNEKDFYGKLYRQRKDEEVEKNLIGGFGEQAKKVLEEKSYKKATVAKDKYEAGMLPDAHLHARARRYAVTMFLAHYHLVGYWLQFNKLPPKPYAIEHLGHAHIILPPNREIVPGLDKALDREWR